MFGSEFARTIEVKVPKYKYFFFESILNLLNPNDEHPIDYIALSFANAHGWIDR